MMRGPAPKPTVLKVLEGNRGRRPLPKNEPKPRAVAPPCPVWLDKEAKKEWKRVCPHLDKLGLLTAVDGTALSAYCQSYSRWKAAEETLTKHGLVFKTPNGYIQQLPQVAIAQKYARIVREYIHEFGLSPSARVRLSIPNGGTPDDPFGAEFD